MRNRSILHDGLHHLVHSLDVELDLLELAFSQHFIDRFIVDRGFHSA